MSTTLRRYWVKALRRVGVRNFRSNSGLGFPYICYLGDFAGEAPFYDRDHSLGELQIMAAWCRTIERPVIFDIGANNGFISTQLAQMLQEHRPRIYAFEPVPSTWAHLKMAVDKLSLNDFITPVCGAVSDAAGLTTLSYNPRESLFAQVRDDISNLRAGTERATAATVTVDEIVESIGVKPDLLKVDVEGLEPRVLAGATKLLSEERAHPAIFLEWNPLTLEETNASREMFAAVLSNFRCYYINDFAGQKMPFGERIPDLEKVTWACNIIALPKTAAAEARWVSTLESAKNASGSRRKSDSACA